MSPLREFALHVAVRGCSAVFSSVAFALIAKLNAVEVAKPIFVFMFIAGFAGALLRSFCMFATGLDGSERRAAKVRRVYGLARRYIQLLPLFAALLFTLLAMQGFEVELWILGLTAVVMVIAGFDFDLVNAPLGRPASFSVAFAAGNIGAVLLLVTFGEGVLAGMLAVLCPWLAITAFNLIMAVRLARSRQIRQSVRTRRGKQEAWLTPLLTAMYDGVVINLPFMVGGRLDTTAGVDLAVAMRLFSSAQPFFPLINHWTSSGRMNRLSTRIGLPESVLYSLSLMLSGWAASSVFVVIYMLISNNSVSALQYSIFSLVLLGIGLFYTAARYRPATLPNITVDLLVVGLLAAFALSWFLGSSVGHSGALKVGVMQFTALSSFAGATYFLSRFLRRKRDPDREH